MPFFIQPEKFLYNDENTEISAYRLQYLVRIEVYTTILLVFDQKVNKYLIREHPCFEMKAVFPISTMEIRLAMH